MLQLLFVVVVIGVALAQGGSLRNLAGLQLRMPWLAGVAFGIQLLIFTPFRETPLIGVATEVLYIFSMALVVGWILINRYLPGALFMAAGVVANTAAIVANGGLMPIWPVAAQIAGRLDLYPETGERVINNSLAAESGVQLWLLTDILPMPAWVPLANVFSIGDVLMTVGACLLCYRTIRSTPEPVPATQPVA
jgi:hypothetical protein